MQGAEAVKKRTLHFRACDEKIQARFDLFLTDRGREVGRNNKAPVQKTDGSCWTNDKRLIFRRLGNC